MKNVTFIGGSTWGGALIQMGQHCGIFSYNSYVPGAGCNVDYHLENVDFSQTPKERKVIQFGVSGGNPIVPIVTTYDDSFNRTGESG